MNKYAYSLLKKISSINSALLKMYEKNIGLSRMHSLPDCLQNQDDTHMRIVVSNRQQPSLPNNLVLHAKPWIPGGEKSIFSAVIHYSEDHLCAKLRVQEQSTNMTDVTMPVPYIRVTSQIKCGAIAMLSQKRPSLATMAKS